MIAYDLGRQRSFQLLKMLEMFFFVSDVLATSVALTRPPEGHYKKYTKTLLFLRHFQFTHRQRN